MPSLKSSPFALLALALEFVALSPAGAQVPDPLRRALITGGYALALVFIWRNRRLRGLQVLGLGLVLNLAPMLLNGGLMPVLPEKMAAAGMNGHIADLALGDPVPRTKDVLKEAEEAPLWFLGDVFVVPDSLHVRGVASPGDLVVLAGLLVTLFSPLVAWSRQTLHALRHPAVREREQVPPVVS